MRALIRVLIVLGLLFALPDVFAQATRTWVSGVGDDANPCSRTAPCKTFAGAISKTAAGGIINVLDPAGYGAVTITKSITIEADGDIAGVLVSGTNGVLVNAALSDRVILRRIKFEGLGTGLSAIRVFSVGELLIDECTVNNFVNGGLDLVTSIALKATVRNSVFSGSSGAAIATDAAFVLQPTGVGTIDLHVQGSTITGGGNGVLITGPVDLVLRDTALSGGALSGLIVENSASVSRVLIESGTISDFAGIGISVAGANSDVRVGNSTITNNGTGLSASSSGEIISFGDNRVRGNNSDGLFTSSESKQ